MPPFLKLNDKTPYITGYGIIWRRDPTHIVLNGFYVTLQTKVVYCVILSPLIVVSTFLFINAKSISPCGAQ